MPPTLIYPVEVLTLSATVGQRIRKHEVLVKFKYWNEVPAGVTEEGEPEVLVTKEFYATFEAPLDGDLVKYRVRVGDRINDHNTPIAEIKEDCDHSVQYGGLCALCGKSLDDKDYLGYNDTDRAPIAMSHDSSGLTVSRVEAERIEASSTQQLLKSRKLILVVDLDQTIIHAAIDPRIGEWMANEKSVNHSACKSVKSFMLREARPQGYVNCCYYIKLRPRLKEFLEEMSKLFEMHIYTMATKVYAREIAKYVDPTGAYFGDRILSREDSGSLLRKHLERLFPVTTSLVTIIDDRGDVWQWSPHLIRVFPYTFFTGTGDINSSFLPKGQGLVTPTLEPPKNEEDEGAAKESAEQQESTAQPTSEEAVPGQEAAAEKDTTEAVNPDDAQPDANANPESGEKSSVWAQNVAKNSTPKRNPLTAPVSNMHRASSTPTLCDKDQELGHIANVLRRVHSTFYEAYDRDRTHVPNIGRILPSLKSKVFDGCVMLFSGVFPVGIPLDSADIVQWVRNFGAVVVAQLIPSVTHVVAKSGGTVKARQAAGAGIPVVCTSWIFACLEDWVRVPEDKYLIRVHDPIMHAETAPVQQDEEPQADLMRGFVRSLSNGDLDWNEMNQELLEFMTDTDSSVLETDDDKSETGENPPSLESVESTKRRAGSDTEHQDSRDSKRAKENGTDKLESEATDEYQDFAAQLERDLS